MIAGTSDQERIAGLSAPDLVAGYEQMRQEFVAGATTGFGARGVALFLRRGMVGWVETLGGAASEGVGERDLATSVPPPHPPSGAAPGGQREEVVRVLASMVLANGGKQAEE